MKDLLKNYISLILEEKRSNGFTKAGDRAQAYFAELEKYVSNSPPYYYIHFSDINKVGINPKYEYSTPFGIYAWILTPSFIEGLKRGGEIFASDRSCVHILEANVSPNELLIIQNIKQPHIKKLIDTLNKEWGGYIPESDFDFGEDDPSQYFKSLVARAKAYATDDSPGAIFWEILNLFSHGDVKLWRRILLSMGYKGVLDVTATDNAPGIIYVSEPLQGVFFSKEYLTQVKTIQNPTSQQICGDSAMDSIQTLIAGLSDAKNINTKFLDFYWDKIMESPLAAKHTVLRALMNSLKHEYDPYVHMILGSFTDPNTVSDMLYTVSATTDNIKQKRREDVWEFWKVWHEAVGSFLTNYDKEKLKYHFGLFL